MSKLILTVVKGNITIINEHNNDSNVHARGLNFHSSCLVLSCLVCLIVILPFQTERRSNVTHCAFNTTKISQAWVCVRRSENIYASPDTIISFSVSPVLVSFHTDGQLSGFLKILAANIKSSFNSKHSSRGFDLTPVLHHYKHHWSSLFLFLVTVWDHGLLFLIRLLLNILLDETLSY